LAREVMFPTYRTMDEAPPRLVEGRVELHPTFGPLYQQVREMGVIAATRPESVGGQQLPLTVGTLANAYLMAGNLCITGLVGLTTGAGHLIEAFGDATVRDLFLSKMYDGRWTGTMALTEPQAGSSLADITTSATPTEDGYRIRGSKIFISGGDHDIAENIVHLVLAKIDGAPPGTKGISLFAVPRRRPESGGLVDNDVQVAGVIHKIGWRGLPSLALSFGDEGDCHGWLVGEPHAGLRQMFQMMNEARIGVGINAAATASVGYHEALGYARDRTQGRALGERDMTAPPESLLVHPDVRRMLLRQKTIVDASFALCAQTACYADVAEHGSDAERERAGLLLDLLTPITKSFPAEYGFEANHLALQVFGGYGYSSEYLPELLLRDQRLNTIHEGTTQIQSLDLLGRKVMQKGGAALGHLGREVRSALEAAELAGLDEAIRSPLEESLGVVEALTMTLGQRGLAGDLEGMLGQSTAYLDLLSIVVVGWMQTRLATAGARRGDDYGRGLVQGARYWAAHELPRVALLAERCRSDTSFRAMKPEWF
ncbi:MAG: acyl-CoA dehydrogenase, partial [Myxococcota bacterium]